MRKLLNQLDPVSRRALLGDVTVLVVMTVAGFATHLTLDAIGRMALTGVTALAAWAAVAVPFGVYRAEAIRDPRSLWRVAWAWTVAAPLATFLRGAFLARDVPPVFVIVVILTNGFALVAWRIYLGWSLARAHSSKSMTSPR